MIKIAHSPDTDDFFLFWAIVNKKINLHGFEFYFEQFDTAELNRMAVGKRFDVIAVSLAVYPQVASDYLILPHGASVGRNYGPVVVAKEQLVLSELANKRIGTPGASTTAAAVLSILAPQARTQTYPIVPYNLGFEALERSEIDALLLIHEGQISYAERALELVVDLGKWWHEEHHLPLPLGINVIKRELGEDKIAQLSAVLRKSISYALEHTEEIVEELSELSKERNTDLKTLSDIEKYLGMYANSDSLALDENCKKAIELLIAPASAEYAP